MSPKAKEPAAGPDALAALDFVPVNKPFARDDIYGQMGMHIPLLEYPRLALASVLLAPLRFVLMFGIIFQFSVVCSILGAIPGEGAKRMVSRLGMLHSRAVLFALGVMRINVTRHGEAGGGDDEALFARAGVVSNHIGWLDILVHMSLFFPSFVAKDGVGKLAVVGAIARNMRCIFVQREAKSKDYKGVSGDVKQRMVERAADTGLVVPPMLLFPEGTTTNGHYLLPFKTGAFLAGAPVRPVLLRYQSSYCSPAWESITMTRHLFLLFCTPWIGVDVDILPVYTPSPAERSDPALYAANVRTRMLEGAGWLRASESTLQDKRAYHAILRGESGGGGGGGGAEGTAKKAE